MDYQEDSRAPLAGQHSGDNHWIIDSSTVNQHLLAQSDDPTGPAAQNGHPINWVNLDSIRWPARVDMFGEGGEGGLVQQLQPSDRTEARPLATTSMTGVIPPYETLAYELQAPPVFRPQSFDQSTIDPSLLTLPPSSLSHSFHSPSLQEGRVHRATPGVQRTGPRRDFRSSTTEGSLGGPPRHLTSRARGQPFPTRANRSSQSSQQPANRMQQPADLEESTHSRTVPPLQPVLEHAGESSLQPADTSLPPTTHVPSLIDNLSQMASPTTRSSLATGPPTAPRPRPASVQIGHMPIQEASIADIRIYSDQLSNQETTRQWLLNTRSRQLQADAMRIRVQIEQLYAQWFAIYGEFNRINSFEG